MGTEPRATKAHGWLLEWRGCAVPTLFVTECAVERPVLGRDLALVLLSLRLLLLDLRHDVGSAGSFAFNGQLASLLGSNLRRRCVGHATVMGRRCCLAVRQPLTLCTASSRAATPRPDPSEFPMALIGSTMPDSRLPRPCPARHPILSSSLVEKRQGCEQATVHVVTRPPCRAPVANIVSRDRGVHRRHHDVISKVLRNGRVERDSAILAYRHRLRVNRRAAQST